MLSPLYPSMVDGVIWAVGVRSIRIQHKTPTEMRGRETFLYFGGVDDSCRVFVNGVPVGGHVAEKPADKDMPFEIRIDSAIDWQAEHQLVTVRVEDLGGIGGVHKKTWLVSKKK